LSSSGHYIYDPSPQLGTVPSMQNVPNIMFIFVIRMKKLENSQFFGGGNMYKSPPTPITYQLFYGLVIPIKQTFSYLKLRVGV
jgi:hypothetical protein